MTLTKNKHTAILNAPRNIEGGRRNPFKVGDKTPQLLAVFLCPSFIHIMAGLLGQALCLVAPTCDIPTPFQPATNDVGIIGGSYPTLKVGITV